jgi:hypothetical protein
MENKRTAMDILFQEIKESKAIMPNALFGYFEMVYNKAKEIETKQMKHAFDEGSMYDYDGGFEEYYKEFYGK